MPQPSKCPGCGGRFVLPWDFPKGASVLRFQEESSTTLPSADQAALQAKLAVSPRWIRPLGVHALQSGGARFIGPPCGNPAEIIVFRGRRARDRAREAAYEWNTRILEQRKSRKAAGSNR